MLFYGDFNAIEARVLVWLAGETHVLNTFKENLDLYVQAYARSFHIDPNDVTAPQRQIGKVQVLALGYQGAVGAFKKMAKGYGVEIPDDEIERIVTRWRESHPNIVNFWYELERKAITAIQNPGQTFYAGGAIPGNGVRYLKDGSFLSCQLPSGRKIYYPYPRLEKKTLTSKAGKTYIKDSVIYKGVDSVTRKFEDQSAYGGLFAENVTQAVARDLLVHAMQNLEQEGYPVVLHVHDEIVVEHASRIGYTPVPPTIALNIKNIMEGLPVWAKDLPIKASVGFGKRYAK